MGVVTPVGVMLHRCGRVELQPTPTHHPLHPHALYRPPQDYARDADTDERVGGICHGAESMS